MASRNKKGKLYNMLSSRFNITFFYKPGGEEGWYNDEYYYVVLDDSIFIKARFIDNAVLMIDSVTSMTISIMAKQYDELVKYLKTIDDITILASCINSGMDFIQACKANNVPAVECPEFISYSEKFYNKYKCYARNDITLYGYYLIALHEESYARAKRVPSEIEELPPFTPDIPEPTKEPPTDVPVEEPPIQVVNPDSPKFNELIDKIMNAIPNLSMVKNEDNPYMVSMSSPNISFTLTNVHVDSVEKIFDLFHITGLVGNNGIDCLKLISTIHDFISQIHVEDKLYNPEIARAFWNKSGDVMGVPEDMISSTRIRYRMAATIRNVNTLGIDDNKVFSAIDGNPYCKVEEQDTVGGTCTYEII